MTPLFDHEKLEVYQHSIEFVENCDQILAKCQKTSSLRDQLDRASISIPLNIAEGNGKWSKKDRCRFFDIAKGSALECAAAIDVAVAKEVIPHAEAQESKKLLLSIVRMLVGLIQANDSERNLQKGEFRVGEDGIDYSAEKEKD